MKSSMTGQEKGDLLIITLLPLFIEMLQYDWL
jgi:hypothetical protein